jgi:hypothetical protein
MFRTPLIVLSLAAIATAAGTELLQHGAYTVTLDPDNAQLPTSIVWQNDVEKTELIGGRTGINFTFTDFRYRNKFYREENRYVWEKQRDARFVTDVRDVGKLTQQGDNPQWAVAYSTSYADVTRTLAIDANTDSLELAWEFTFTTDLIVHELIYFGIMLQLHTDFTGVACADAEAESFALLRADGVKRVQRTLTPLNPGPFLAFAESANVLVSHACSGDLPTPLAPTLLRFAKGQQFRIALSLTCAPAGDARLPAAMATAHAAAPPAQRPFLLYENANIRVQRGEGPAAERLLLAAAAAHPQYAQPFARLAQLRTHAKTAGMSAAECFAYASYRQPYNYGWSLSGRGFVDDRRLSSAEQQQVLMNLLISVENTQFYPDYYVWVAQDFERRGMDVQACAMTRQALWALEWLPRTEAHREKVRKRLEKKLTELETRIRQAPTATLPPMTAVFASELPGATESAK